MREIKFRAWSKKEKKMYEVGGMAWGVLGDGKRFVYQIDCSKNLAQEQTLKPFIEQSIENVALMQYTGLLDKNGKEIYEGDIVEAWDIERLGSFNIPDDCIGRVIQRDEFKGEVIYEKGQFIINGDDMPISAWGEKEYLDSDHNIEIIGNIYENSELLENK